MSPWNDMNSKIIDKDQALIIQSVKDFLCAQK